jgi:hypothetical protein
MSRSQHHVRFSSLKEKWMCYKLATMRFVSWLPSLFPFLFFKSISALAAVVTATRSSAQKFLRPAGRIPFQDYHYQRKLTFSSFKSTAQSHGRHLGDWTETAKIKANDGIGRDEFGYSLAIDGDVLVVGANQYWNGGPGSAYVFQDSTGNSNWVEVAKLTASDGAQQDRFGWSVAVSGNTIVVGARFDDNRMCLEMKMEVGQKLQSLRPVTVLLMTSFQLWPFLATL